VLQREPAFDSGWRQLDPLCITLCRLKSFLSRTRCYKSPNEAEILKASCRYAATVQLGNKWYFGFWYLISLAIAKSLSACEKCEMRNAGLVEIGRYGELGNHESSLNPNGNDRINESVAVVYSLPMN
jgi:hypothetical protein